MQMHQCLGSDQGSGLVDFISQSLLLLNYFKQSTKWLNLSARGVHSDLQPLSDQLLMLS